MQALITDFLWNQCDQHGAAGTGTGGTAEDVSISAHVFSTLEQSHNMDVLAWYLAFISPLFKACLILFELIDTASITVICQL